MKKPQTIENTWHPVSKTSAERHKSTKSERSDAHEAEISSSASNEAPNSDEHNERERAEGASIALPTHVAGSGTLDRLVDTARGYAEASTAENTNKAYAADWKHFARWCRLKGTDLLPPSPEMIGLYVADLAAPAGKAPALSVSTIERRLSGLAWNYTQRGFTLDRKDRHIATVLAGIKRKHARPPVQKEAILAEDILAMVATLPYDLRGLRDRAILLLGFAGGLRRSEIVSLDVHKDDTPDSGGWVEIFEGGAMLKLNAKTGWREVEICDPQQRETLLASILPGRLRGRPIGGGGLQGELVIGDVALRIVELRPPSIRSAAPASAEDFSCRRW